MAEKFKLFYNPDCSKCREAKSLLEGEACAFELIEYLQKVPSVQELKELLMLLGIQAQDLIRKGEPIYQEHFLNVQLDNEGWIEVMIKHPVLIERPILISGNKAVIGRPPVKVLDLL